MIRPLILIIVILSLSNIVSAQKGDFSVSGGPMLSLPQNDNDFPTRLSTGLGVEIMGQYNVSNRSSLILQTNWASYGTKSVFRIDTGSFPRRTIFSFRGGYRYQFGSSGVFTHILGGTERYSGTNGNNSTFALGLGKRFVFKESYFVDAGIDCVSRTTDFMFNIKVLFGFVRSRNE